MKWGTFCGPYSSKAHVVTGPMNKADMRFSKSLGEGDKAKLPVGL